MAIDIEAGRAQQRELNMISDEITFAKRKVQLHQIALDDAWKSYEIRGIDSYLEDVVYRLNRLADELNNLGLDVMAVGEEIRAEEEATERAIKGAEERAQEENVVHEKEKNGDDGGNSNG